MMLQADRPISVWGRGPHSSEICVHIKAYESRSDIRYGCTKTSENGDFQVKLPSLPASFTTYTVTVQNQTESKIIQDVLVGEVWLASGQSNMQLEIKYSLEREVALETAKNSNIRVFTQEHVSKAMRHDTSPTPLFDVSSGHWSRADQSENIAPSPAIGYFFARALFHKFTEEDRQVPIGIIGTAVGSTGVYSWISQNKMTSSGDLRENLPINWQKAPTEKLHDPFLQATASYNHKVGPLTSFAIRGFLWQQGEGDKGDEATAQRHKYALKSLIEDWRDTWKLDNMPFIIAQPHGTATPFESAEDLDEMAYVREAQSDIAKEVAKVCTLPIYDVELTWNWGNFGYQHPIHPLSKKPIGERMAKAAWSLVYGGQETCPGPVLKDVVFGESKAVVNFANVSRGLKMRGSGDKLSGFAIAGEDRRFFPATAKIRDATSIDVWSPQVKAPTAVTYGFTRMNQHSNLFDQDDLPAIPFRSDRSKSDYVRIMPTLTYEAEFQKIGVKSPEDGSQVRSHPEASRGAVSFFRARGPEDFISWKLKIIHDADYRLVIRLMVGPDHGKIQVFIDDQPLGSIIDAYRQNEGFARYTLAEKIRLKPGSHSVKIVVKDRHEKAVGYVIRLDKIELAPIGPNHPSIHENW